MSSRTVRFGNPGSSFDMSRFSGNITNDSSLLHAPELFVDQQQSYAGILIGLTLENFMNFSSLYINFNSKVNLITGVKSSGKSAIQRAIWEVFCTDTAASKQLIKTGCNSCLIELVLSNVGPRAYQPSLFGSEIILCRTITCETNSIQLKNQAGTVISSSDEDLLNLRSLLCIETWNPVTIMSKDSVAAFFSLDPKTIYDIFAQATMIDEIMELANAQSVNAEELAQQILRSERERQCLEIDIEGLQTKRACLERTHGFLVEREKTEADYVTWAKKDGNAIALAEHQLSFRHLNVEAANLEEEILENMRCEFDARKRMAEVQKIGAKIHEQLVKYNSLLRKFGFGEVMENLEALPRQWNNPDINRLVEIKSSEVQVEFLGVLSARNVKARMIIDHNRREIRIMARPMNSSTAQNTVDCILLGETDVSRMNSDERAYFNFALILALWKVSDSPFFSMDAFYEFLSPVSERYIIELLLLTAREKSRCQFIFFMPEVPPMLQPSPTISLFNLGNPEKRQGNVPRQVQTTNSDGWIDPEIGLRNPKRRCSQLKNGARTSAK